MKLGDDSLKASLIIFCCCFTTSFYLEGICFIKSVIVCLFVYIFKALSESKLLIRSTNMKIMAQYSKAPIPRQLTQKICTACLFVCLDCGVDGLPLYTV